MYQKEILSFYQKKKSHYLSFTLNSTVTEMMMMVKKINLTFPEFFQDAMSFK